MIDALIRTATCLVTCGDEISTGHHVAPGAVLTARHGVLEAISAGMPIRVHFAETGKAIAVDFTATLSAHSAELDACLLTLTEPCDRPTIPLAVEKPREGVVWQSFGYPQNKTVVGHRLAGTISHLLPVRAAKVDIDLSIDADKTLENYHGLSGSTVVEDAVGKGMLLFRQDGTLGAISVHALAPFLHENGVLVRGFEPNNDSSSQATEVAPQLAERTEFQRLFEAHVLAHAGAYMFLEGAHGIGKTTFCNTFSPSDPSLAVLGTYSIVPPNGGSNAYTRSQPDVFFDWLSTTVSTLLFGAASRYEQGTYPTLVKYTEDLLAQFSEHCGASSQVGLLFIDGLSEIRDADPSLLPRFLGLLPDILPPHIVVVMTSPSYSALAAMLSRRVESRNVLLLLPLPADACESYCWQELDGDRANAAFIGSLCNRAQGHPLYLRYLIQYANEHPEDDNLDEFPVLSGPIEQYYEGIWAKLLGDADTLTLLAIIARLRPGLDSKELSKSLTASERSVFLPTLSRIQHLLLRRDQPALYHASFATFLISKTADSEEEVHTRLGAFCQREQDIRYCVFNVVYHLLRGDEPSQAAAITVCSQSWVDLCVSRGVTPDALLTDVRFALMKAVQVAPPVDTIRLLLLTQRIEFRYNTLLTQSAELMAGALIALGRPAEALNHIIRYDSLMTDVWSALRIANTLLRHNHDNHARTLLDLVRRTCQGAYSTPDLGVDSFMGVCAAHIHSCLLLKITGAEEYVVESFQVRTHARNVLESGMPDAAPDAIAKHLSRLDCIPLVHLLYFADTYVGLSHLRNGTAHNDATIALILLDVLLSYADFLRVFELPLATGRLAELFKDIHQLLELGVGGNALASPLVIDALISLGAPYPLVALAGRAGAAHRPAGDLRARNGVDVDFEYFYRCAIHGRAAGFLDTATPYPLTRTLEVSGGETWLKTIEDTHYALSFCEGRLRRKVADADETAREEAGRHLVTTLLSSVRFSLAQRVGWDRSYAIPESVVPSIYERATEVLCECFPEGVADLLRDLEERSADQIGLYSEGYRTVLQVVLGVLQRGEPDQAWQNRELALIGLWRDHVLGGVENRHELVPELLRLIVAFAQTGAHEEAENLFLRMLSVSMGPNWYKEDQFGLMTGVLRQMPKDQPPGNSIAAVAGYLELASGEMTFQRYVRYVKSVLLGILFAKGRFRQGCQYYMRQTCGTNEQLSSDWERNGFDAPTPRRGNRHLCGALEEQGGILEIVRNAGESVPWRLRWALLEVFHLGDERHLEDFAAEYAGIVGEVGAVSPSVLAELIGRIEMLSVCETSPRERRRFISAFHNHLAPGVRAAFAVPTFPSSSEEESIEDSPIARPVALPRVQLPPTIPQDEADGEGEATREETNELFMPGLFGTQASMVEADAILIAANRQLQLGNRRAAKQELTRMLQTLQEGGWSVWSVPSKNARRAEDLLRELSSNQAELLHGYAPLIHSERYAAPWRIAEHLISRLGSLLGADDRNRMLSVVLEHVALMTGDASHEIAKFGFFDAEDTTSDPRREMFALLLWLVDHPKWIRRDRAATTVAWLLRTAPSFDDLAVPTAFVMTEGYAADVLCGALDHLSREDPTGLWRRVETNISLDTVVTDCRHVSRLASLHAIAQRADTNGSNAAGEAAQRVASLFRGGLIALPDNQVEFNLPEWADCVGLEWNTLDQLGTVTAELGSKFIDHMTRLCSPLSIQDAYNLEFAVSSSFRESPRMRFGRWEAKVRFALNCALQPYVSGRDLQDVAEVMRITNPAIPDAALNPGFDSPFKDVFGGARRPSDYSRVTGDDNDYFLNYDEVAHVSGSEKPVHIQVVAVLVPIVQGGWATAPPSPESVFWSTQVPDLQTDIGSKETCFSLEPVNAFFGSFTPGYPAPAFVEMIGASADDFRRISWRGGRSTRPEILGRPVNEGCLLAVKRSAVRLPPDRKLAWVIRVDGRVIAITDRNT